MCLIKISKKFQNKINDWKEFTLDSTNTAWKLNPGHFFRYHTSRPPRSHRYYQYSLHEQNIRYQNAYIIFMKTFYYRKSSITLKRQCTQF